MSVRNRVLPALVPLLVVAGALGIGGSSYAALSLSDPGRLTSVVSALLQGLALVSCAIALGQWVLIGLIRPYRRDRPWLRPGDLTPALWASLVWAAASSLLVVVDAADGWGTPLADLSRPGLFGNLIGATYLPHAWVVTACCAWALAALSLLATRWTSVLLALLLLLLGMLAPALVTQLLVGANHDFAGDAGIFGVPAFLLAVGLVVCWLWAAPPVRADPTALRRLTRTLLAATVIVLASDVLIGWFELAGAAPWSVPTGRLLLVKAALLIAGVALALTRPQPPGPLLAAAVLLFGALGVSGIAFRVPPPHYFELTSVPQNFFGFSIGPPPGIEAFLTQWRPNVLFVILATLAVGSYLAGVVRLHRRGDAWPAGRTIAWVLGWAVIVLATSSGAGRYAAVSFSVHMAVHMAMNMLGPLLLVLGGVLTLALRATQTHRRDEPTGPHEWLAALTQSRMMRAAYNPLVVFAFFVGSYYVLYFTGLFEQTLRYHFAHQASYLHFLITGYLFYGLAIGVDPPPRPVPPLAKLGMILAAMPFHAFFGVVLMTRESVIADNFYRSLELPWITESELTDDQFLGGGIAWAAGEFPLLIVVIAFVVQWARQDSAEARRVDRHLDKGTDASYDDYNAMLAKISTRDRIRQDQS